MMKIEVLADEDAVAPPKGRESLRGESGRDRCGPIHRLPSVVGGRLADHVPVRWRVNGPVG